MFGIHSRNKKMEKNIHKPLLVSKPPFLFTWKYDTLWTEERHQKRYESKEMKNIVFILVMCIFFGYRKHYYICVSGERRGHSSKWNKCAENATGNLWDLKAIFWVVSIVWSCCLLLFLFVDSFSCTFVAEVKLKYRNTSNRKWRWCTRSHRQLKMSLTQNIRSL